VQQPHPPIWIAANSDAAVQRAAELGDTWIINPHATLETISRQMGLYRAALARVGKAFPNELPMMREVFVAESRAEAVRAARPHLEKKYQAYVQWGQHRVLPKDDDMTQRFDDLVRDRFILGDPDDCAAEIRRVVERTGATTLVFRVHWPGLDHAAVVRAIRLLGEKVRPKVG
jgi:alkanesulfonate monooxygenase SsuD/methylene tetrahydromethanopterin reductase-like flavin-dependent oxidoreductase (luciferase family)